MSEAKNIQTIQGIYDAFGRGDVRFILGQLTPGTKWLCHFDPIVPWGGDYTGKDKSEFFDAIFCSVDVLGFEPGEFVTEGDTVVSVGTFACKSKATGKSANTRWVFIWKLKDGKVVSYEQFHDPAIGEVFRA